MAKKVRTPPPPRRVVQAPKRREASARDADPLRQRRILYILAASGVLLLGAVVLFLALAGRGGDGSAELAKTMTAAGFTFRTYPNQGRGHVRSLDAKVEYNSFPPTSGTHYEIPAIWDLYDRPINEVQGVHNLEHGGILIQYGDKVPQATVNEIAEFYREDPNGLLVAPLPRLGDKIALTAWRHLATGTRFDEKAFKAFRDTYRGNGPEGFKTEDLQPGAT